MIGLFVLGAMLASGVVIIAAIGFVTLTVATISCRLMVKAKPAFGRMIQTAGFLVAALLLAVWSVDIVAGAANRPERAGSVFAFVQPTYFMAAVTDDDTNAETQKDNRPESPDTDSATTVDTLTKQPAVTVHQVLAEQDSSIEIQLPSWARNATTLDGPAAYYVLKSKMTVTRDKAMEHIHQQAAKVIRDDFMKHNSAEVSWELPRQVVEDSIRRTYTVKETVDLTDSLTQEMQTVYAQVAVSPSMRKAIYPGWRRLVASQRLVKLGQGFGIATILVMSLATYLRYDKQTMGKKKGRLGALSLAILATGSVTVAALGDTLKEKLSSAGIVEAGYMRDRLMDDTLIGREEGPLIDVTGQDTRIVILIDNTSDLQRPGFISKRLTESIESLPAGTTIDIHDLRSVDGSESKVGFNGGQANHNDIRQLISRPQGQTPAEFSGALKQVVASAPDSIFVVTEGLAELSHKERSTMASIGSQVPINFIKLIDDQPIQFDDSLRAFATRTGGYLRFLDTGK
ncbi:hypothetical protein OAH18_00350 [bacterium]|nr:hypothetical protein [bacterium]